MHFSDQPKEVLKEAARVLETSGQMVIVDFLSHEREELRTTYRHQRLGFSNDEIEQWLYQVGFMMRPPISFEGEHLTVVIWIGIGGKLNE